MNQEQAAATGGCRGRPVARTLVQRNEAVLEELRYSRRANTKDEIVFAFIPKGKCSKRGPFFGDIWEGAQSKAEQLSHNNVRVECIGADYAGVNATQMKQEELLANLTASSSFDGIAIAVRFPEEVHDAIANATAAGIPVVTFDSDAPDSDRAAYIGTDNVAMGKELAKVLKQLRPEGGNYVLVSGTGANLLQRIEGVRDELEGSRWKEAPNGPIFPIEGTNILDQMWNVAENSTTPIDAMIPVFGSPMKEDRWKEFAAEYRHRMAFVSTDMNDYQIDYLAKGYADGLVGQQPFDMGQQSIQVLYDLTNNATTTTAKEIYGTNFIEILRVPYQLPEVDFDYNYLGNLVILGYIAFSILAALTLACQFWTLINRNKRVVRASQPLFLYLMADGVLIFASSIIPLGIDDEHYSLEACNAACQSVPWLVSLGFSLIFAALFAKTWRVNQIFHNPNKYQRLTVTATDVSLPLIVLMAANAIVLTCWTIFDPLQYVREFTDGTDLWNRPIASYGSCQSTGDSRGGSIPYLVLLGVINLGALVFAIWEAYRARDIQTEFSESKYVAMVFASITQATVIGVPILALERDNPSASYIIQTLLVFVLGMVVLLLIFVPKYICHQEWLVQQAIKKAKKEANGANNVLDSTISSTTTGSQADGMKIMVQETTFKSLRKSQLCQQAPPPMEVLDETNQHATTTAANGADPDDVGRPPEIDVEMTAPPLEELLENLDEMNLHINDTDVEMTAPPAFPRSSGIHA